MPSARLVAALHAALAAALLSGCLGDGGTANAAAGAPAARTAFGLAHGDGTPGAPFTSADGITELHWATDATGPFAVEFALALGDGACRAEAALSGSSPAAAGVVLVEGDGGRGWASGGSVPLARAHAGPLDGQDLLGAGPGSGFGATWTLKGGDAVVTLVGAGLRDPETGDLEGSMAFSLTCDTAFAVAARGSPEALFAVPETLRGGAGASVLAVGAANVADRAALEFASPVVRATVGCLGDQVADVALDHPGGQDGWECLPGPVPPATAFGLVEGPAGDYAFTVNHVGAASTLWIAAWGLEPLDLRPGLRMNSAIEPRA